MPRILNMSSLTVGYNDCDIYVNKVSSGNYIPIIVAHSSIDVGNLSPLTIENPSYLMQTFKQLWVASSHVGTTSSIPDYSVFLSSYDVLPNLNITATASANNLKRIDVTITTKYTYGGSTYSFTSSSTIGYPTTTNYGGAMVFIAVVEYNGTYYLPTFSNRTSWCNHISGYQYTTPNTMPVNGVSKGYLGTIFEVSNDLINCLGPFIPCNELIDNSKLWNPDNPFIDAGDAPEDPGQGEFDYDSDEIPIPDLPTVSVTSTGFVTLYTPSATELKNLANYLWSDLFSLDTFKKMFNNPMDCILGLTIVPLNLPTGAAQEITVGNIVTTVSCTTCPTQYVTVDCGSFIFSKSEFTASYLDYSPYTKLFLYLPYIGIQEINIDEFMGHTMSIVYHCDILTGALFCYVLRDDRIIYTYSGTCAENVPLSSNDFSTTIGSIMGAASAVAGTVATVATGGMAAPAVAGTIAKGVVSTASNVMGAKPSISHSGSLGGGSGIMGVQYPYLIFNAPRIATVDEQNSYTGFASNKIVKLSDLSGYNVIEAINLSVEGATDTECDEIKRILMEGVII